MPLPLKSLVFFTVLGGMSLLRADNFSVQAPADSFLYIETRDLPGFQERFAQTEVSKKLKLLPQSLRRMWRSLFLP
jgi:hypothetical protein